MILRALFSEYSHHANVGGPDYVLSKGEPRNTPSLTVKALVTSSARYTKIGFARLNTQGWKKSLIPTGPAPVRFPPPGI